MYGRRKRVFFSLAGNKIRLLQRYLEKRYSILYRTDDKAGKGSGIMEAINRAERGEIEACRYAGEQYTVWMEKVSIDGYFKILSAYAEYVKEEEQRQKQQG